MCCSSWDPPKEQRPGWSFTDHLKDPLVTSQSCSRVCSGAGCCSSVRWSSQVCFLFTIFSNTAPWITDQQTHGCVQTGSDWDPVAGQWGLEYSCCPLQSEEVPSDPPGFYGVCHQACWHSWTPGLPAKITSVQRWFSWRSFPGSLLGGGVSVQPCSEDWAPGVQTSMFWSRRPEKGDKHLLGRFPAEDLLQRLQSCVRHRSRSAEHEALCSRSFPSAELSWSRGHPAVPGDT